MMFKVGCGVQRSAVLPSLALFHIVYIEWLGFAGRVLLVISYSDEALVSRVATLARTSGSSLEYPDAYLAENM